MGKRGHYCSICGCCKPNERFSGKGHRNHICKDCQKMPKAKRQEIRDQGFVWSVMDQKNISKGNMATLQRIATDYDTELGEQGAALLEMAKVKPHRKKRIRWLYENRHPLFVELVRLGLIADWDGDYYGMNARMVGDAHRELDLRCLEIDTELRFHYELIEAYEADAFGVATK